MPFARPAPLALLLLALGAGEARPQSSLAPAPGTLAPPRATAQPATPPSPAPRLVPAEQPRNLAAPPARPQPAQPFRAPQAQAPARPSATPARPPTPQARPRPAPPTVGGATPPANRRPAAAAATARPAPPALPETPAAPTVGPVTGLPLPRFAALRSDEVNMRVGPSTSYPIEWTFQRRDLPVQIVGEFQLWRRIRDADGAEGWVHSSTLAGRRTVLVRPAATTPEATLRRRAEDSAAAVARIRPGVIARIRECEADAPWCEVQVAGHRGYLRRTEIWGVGATEEIK